MYGPYKRHIRKSLSFISINIPRDNKREQIGITNVDVLGTGDVKCNQFRAQRK